MKVPSGTRSAEQSAAIPAPHTGAVGEDTNHTGGLDAPPRGQVVGGAPRLGVEHHPRGGKSFREIDPREGWTLARGWGLADAQLGGRLPPLPPEDGFWFGGALQDPAWMQAHALLRDRRLRAAAQAQQ